MIELMSETAGRIVGVRLSGRTTPEERRAIRPRLQSLVETVNGPLRLLVDLSAFDGESEGAESDASGGGLWFGDRFGAQIERLALIADSRWAGEVARYRSVLARADVRRFDPADSVGARAWVANGG